jgi:hypothetical protein
MKKNVCSADRLALHVDTFNNYSGDSLPYFVGVTCSNRDNIQAFSSPPPPTPTPFSFPIPVFTKTHSGPKTEASEFEVRPVKIVNQEVRLAFGFYQTFYNIL